MARTTRKRKSSHGGQRRGAGAPLGNMNGYKTGLYSKQVKAMSKALAVAPLTATYLAKVTGRDAAKLELYARALHYYADMLMLFAKGHAIKNNGPLQIHAKDFFQVLIKQSSDAARRDMSMEVGGPPG